jgi:hypothetical protein
MIFKDIIDEQQPKIKKGVENLFENAEENQRHPQDLLLIINHVFKDEKHRDIMLIGPGDIGYAEKTQYEFYDYYRTSHMEESIADFDERKKDEDGLEYAERISINIEKSIYLKFWESDMIIKKMKQLVNLATGKNYDFSLKIPVHNRDGSKQEIIRLEIRDEIEEICPEFYGILKDTYLSQIRNAIAHSQYYIGKKRITYLNYSSEEKAYCPVDSLSFEEWAYYIHNTLLLHNELIKNLTNYKDKYYKKTKDNDYVEARVIKKDGSEEYKKLGLREDGSKEWVWYDNLEY